MNKRRLISAIKRAMRRKKITLEHLTGHRVGHKSNLSKILNCKLSATTDKLVAIAKACGINYREISRCLFGRTK